MRIALLTLAVVLTAGPAFSPKVDTLCVIRRSGRRGRDAV